MNTKDTFDFMPGNDSARTDLMDQAGAANDRMYVMGRYPELTRTDSVAFDGTQVGSEGFLASENGLGLE